MTARNFFKATQQFPVEQIKSKRERKTTEMKKTVHNHSPLFVL